MEAFSAEESVVTLMRAHLQTMKEELPQQPVQTHLQLDLRHFRAKELRLAVLQSLQQRHLPDSTVKVPQQPVVVLHRTLEQLHQLLQEAAKVARQVLL